MASINDVNQALAAYEPYFIVSYLEYILMSRLPTMVFNTIKLLDALRKRKPTARPPLNPIQLVSAIDRVTRSRN